MTEPGCERRPPRAEARILEATVELLQEVGFGGLTMEGIAERAGVGKATLYRHWSGVAPLAVDAIDAVLHPPRPPETGDLRTDLVQLLHGLHHALAATAMGRVLPSLLDAAPRDPELACRLEKFSERRRVVEAVIVAAQQRGELAADVDPASAVDLLVGPLFYRWLVLRAESSDELIDDIVDTVLTGLRAERPECSDARAPRRRPGGR